MKLVQMTKVSKNPKFDNCFNVSRSGMGGGLAMSWNSKMKVDIVSYSNHHIDVVIYGANGKNW